MDKALALSLVRSHLVKNTDYLSWVPPHTSIRWSRERPHSIRVGGHYRRKAMYAKLIKDLECTCKLQEM